MEERALFRIYAAVPGFLLFVLLAFGTLHRARGSPHFPTQGFVSLSAVGHGRSLQQLNPPQSADNVSNNFLILAEDRTARRDPLNSFEVYRDGWDIRNRHYWASVGYTAAPGFVLAAAWLLLGAVGLLLTLCCCCCCRHKLHGKHQGGNFLPLLFLLLFTAAAVAGCILVYIGQGKSHDELSGTLNYVVQQSDLVVSRLYNVSGALAEAQNLTVIRFALPASDQAQIAQLNTRIDVAARTLQNKTRENTDRISSGLNRVRLAMVVVVGVMLLLVLLGFLFSMLGAMPLMFLLLVLGWFLVAGTWILCGIYIMLNNTVGDTCIAMEEWVANPSATTNLEDILPCVDTNTTNQTLLQTRDVGNDTVTNINNAVTFINGGATGGLPLICNPVHPELSPPSCANITDVSGEWAKLVCNTPGSSTCPVGGRLTPTLFEQLDKSAKVVNTLNNDAPFLLDLQNCQFVRQVFTTIHDTRCHPLRKYFKWQYIGLALISGGLMFAILLWVVYSRRRKHVFFHHKQPVEPQSDQFMQKATPHEAA